MAFQSDPLSLDCDPTGNPPPSLTWLRDGEPLAPINGRLTISSDGVVVITSLYSTDEGNYTCVARNSEGSDSASTLLTVLGERLLTVYSCLVGHVDLDT